MYLIYRISDSGYKKEKPEYVNNENCLKNAIEKFPLNIVKWKIIGDNISEQTYNMILKYVPSNIVDRVNIGNGAGTFNLALNFAEKLGNNEIVYFLENDYLHRNNSLKILEEGIDLDFVDYVTLYDHPDKYIDKKLGGNCKVKKGGEKTRVLITETTHWKYTCSTTMTFACKVKTLKKDMFIWRFFTKGKHPHDRSIFKILKIMRRNLISPILGYSTHGETHYLTKFIDWSKEV